MFLTPLRLVADPQTDMWVLDAPLVWCDPLYGRIEAPAGFRTDLASIPRLFRNIPFLDPNGVSRRPAAMHDWLYAAARRGGASAKRFADNFLYASLVTEGASRGAARAFYLSVHWFGRWAWADDEGALESRDFATSTQYDAWRVGGQRGRAGLLSQD